ncbi:MAG: PQQ-binding-like beta-propeller repeat protein [bacterium]|nr:PQQ-binding-like beta-propeller repeat protein [bacterium]
MCKYDIALADTGKPKVAIVPFDLLNKDSNSTAGKQAAEVLTTELVALNRFAVIERVQLERILEEQKISLSGILEDKNPYQIGQIMHVNYLIIGSIIKEQGTFLINSRLVDINGGYIISVQSAKASKLSSAIKILAEKIIDDFPLEGNIVKIKDDDIVINLGKNQGLSPKTELTIFSPEGDGKIFGKARVKEIGDDVSRGVITMHYIPEPIKQGFKIHTLKYQEQIDDKSQMNWDMFLRDRFHSGFVPVNMELPFSVKWRKNLGRTSALVCRNNAVYLASGIQVSAISTENGSVIWEKELPDILSSSPALYKNMLYIGSSDYNLYALSMQDGEIKWKFKTNSYVNSSPVVYDEKVFFASFDGYIYVVDSVSGELVWKLKIEGWSVSGETLPSPTVTEENVYLGTYNGHLYAVDMKYGFLKWEHFFGAKINLPVCFIDGVVYAAVEDGEVYALDGLTGKVIWKSTCHYKNIASLATDGNYLIINDFIGNICKLNGSNGSKIWEIKSIDQMPKSSVVVANNLIIISTKTGLIALNKITGENLWSYQQPNSEDIGPPIIYKDLVLVNFSPYLYAFSSSRK